MPSRALTRWETHRFSALDEIASAHAAVGGVGPGRRYATQQINQAYAVLLCSQFQGFCRDLHSEAVDHLCGPRDGADARLILLRTRLTAGRRLDFGNPNPGNLGRDFGYFDLDFWAAVDAIEPQARAYQEQLEVLNAWRNAIAHQDFDDARLGGTVTLRLQHVREWRACCNHLAERFDIAVGRHLAILTGVMPW